MPGSRYLFQSRPGVRRDGTELDSPFYSDGVWVRWQRGKPRKMGGYRAMSRLANGPVRAVFADSRNDTNSAHYFSQWGVQRQEFDNTGAGGNLEDRTPVGFTRDAAFTWSTATMYSSTGSPYTAIIASATPDLNDLASDALGSIYYGDIESNDPLVPITASSSAITTSGGICVLQPFLFVYGSNGLIRNSNTNNFSDSNGWTTGGANFANSANVAATKFVYGAPVRGGGQSPSGLFWALDSLVRVSFTSDSRIWAYDTLTNPTSIMSKKCVIELDGKFYWIGTDRFFFYNGVVQELPNNMNQNWFFDNLNYAYRNKVWGTKNTRWGELWWYYPRGSDTECNDAIIYNYREDTWYDAVLTRSAGDCVQTFQFPIWAGSEDAQETKLLVTGLQLTMSDVTTAPSAVLTFTSTTGVVNGMVVSGDPGIPFGSTISSHTATTVTINHATTSDVASGTIITFTSMTTDFVDGSSVTGGTSSAVGTAVRVQPTQINVKNVTGTFVSGETITGIGGATAVIQSAPLDQELDAVYQQEIGKDKVVDQTIDAIPSSFTSANFGFAVGDPFNDVPKTADIMTSVGRFEPDFNQTGSLTVTVQGRSYANTPMRDLKALEVAENAPFVDFRQQERILRIKVESNEAGGFYEQGQVMVELNSGDERPSTVT